MDTEVNTEKDYPFLVHYDSGRRHGAKVAKK